MHIFDYGQGIHAIDSGYERENLAAIHFIADGRELAIVDTAVNASVPRILAAIEQLHYAPQEVRYILLTHIHLDHAGGAGTLMQACPNATLAVHPRGARHMADPSKLWDATKAVYGAARAAAMYGTLLPIAPTRIVETPHEFKLPLGARTLTFLDTPGHARHHAAIHDSASGHIFSGDTFGLSYRELDQDGLPFVIPTSSPTQFEPEAAHRSIDLMAGYRPEAVYMTHFSQAKGVPRLAEIMHRLIDEYAALAARHATPAPGREASLRQGLDAIILAEANRQGLRHSREKILEVLDLDLGLNAQGLVSYLDAQAAKRGG